MYDSKSILQHDDRRRAQTEATVRLCIHSSNQILASCHSSQDENQRRVGRIIRTELGSLEDSLQLSRTAQLGANVHSIVEHIGLPHEIKDALRSELRNVHTEVDGHLNMNGLVLALRPLSSTRHPLINAYRPMSKLLSTMVNCARLSSLKSLQPKSLRLLGAKSRVFAQRYPGLKIPLGIQATCPATLKLLLETPDFTRFYGRSTSSGRGMFFVFNPDHLANQNTWAKFAILAQKLRYLGGDDDRSGAEIRNSSTSASTVHLDPYYYEMTDAGLVANKTVIGFRIPYGALSSSFSDLTRAQAQIEAGELQRFTLTILGRVDDQFLKWLFQGEAKLDPIPDVEILYCFNLCDSEPYWITLKAARGYHSARNKQFPKHSPVNQELIRAVAAYFLDPYNRRAGALLTDVRSCDYSVDQQAMWLDPGTIDSVHSYASLWRAWNKSQHTQLIAALNGTAGTLGQLRSSAIKSLSLDEYTTHALNILRSIPDIQSYYPPDYFKLSLEEQRRFATKIIPSLYRIYTAERQRIISEANTNIRAARAQDGYVGPIEGYQLPLMHALMDMVVHLRREQAYQRSHLRSTDSSPESVVVPPQVGRRYDMPQRFFGVEQISSVLQAASQKPEFQKKAVVRVVDPLSKNRIIEHPIEELDSVVSRCARESWDRLQEPIREAICAVKRDLALRVEHYLLDEVYVNFLEGWWQKICDDTSALHSAVVKLSKNFKARNMAIWQKLQCSGETNAAARSHLKTLSAQHEMYVSRLISSRDNAIKQGILLAQLLFEEELLRHLVRVDSVVDEQRIKLVYSIGADQTPVFDLVVPDGDGERRAAHSELLGGRAMYGGGELIFSRGAGVFRSKQAWMEHRAQESAADSWRLVELNDCTGHYRVLVNTLPYSRKVIFREMQRVGIDTSYCAIVDAVALGLKVMGTGVYRF